MVNLFVSCQYHRHFWRLSELTAAEQNHKCMIEKVFFIGLMSQAVHPHVSTSIWDGIVILPGFFLHRAGKCKTILASLKMAYKLQIGDKMSVTSQFLWSIVDWSCLIFRKECTPWASILSPLYRNNLKNDLVKVRGTSDMDSIDRWWGTKLSLWCNEAEKV